MCVGVYVCLHTLLKDERLSLCVVFCPLSFFSLLLLLFLSSIVSHVLYPHAIVYRLGLDNFMKLRKNVRPVCNNCRGFESKHLNQQYNGQHTPMSSHSSSTNDSLIDVYGLGLPFLFLHFGFGSDDTLLLSFPLRVICYAMYTTSK